MLKPTHNNTITIEIMVDVDSVLFDVNNCIIFKYSIILLVFN